ncbi:hypothetical protein EAH80_11185 [Mycobacterium hodleri]|uniref:Uncharacterized protein n=2 Tax=Mycolicibacterium hodleri TaxID=49897 RepID=A0A502E8W0_9MYCO|nr:hypothetical protein EAH80_11185 [Mycolicibacterium hodleri]
MGIEQLGSEPTCSTAKDITMVAPTKIRSPYETRLELIKTTITAHSKLDDDVAGELAVEVLRALASIPAQRVR